jgi:hypothetical protein
MRCRALTCRHVYLGAGIKAWALWVPGKAKNFEAPDDIRPVDRLKRDSTTLLMRSTLRPRMPRHQRDWQASHLRASNSIGVAGRSCHV